MLPRRRLWIAFSCLLLGAAALPCRAQQTNMALFQELALNCLAAAPDTVQRFRLDAPAQMPYLRTALTRRWQDEDRSVYLADSTYNPQTPPLPTLQYHVEEARLTYTRAQRRLRRMLVLTVRYTLTAEDGHLLREQTCRDTFTDTIARKDHVLVETEQYPETQAPLPEAGWVRRYLEPAVLAAATALGIYLFFSLRSTRTDAGT